MATQSEVLSARPRAGALHRDRFFYMGMSAAILLAVSAAFGGRYYLRSFSGAPPLPTYVHVHAVVFTGWVLLFCAQAALVATGGVRLHRRLGAAGGVLAGLMVVLGVATAIEGARRGHNPSGGAYPDALAFLVVGLTDILLFTAFVGAGLYYRHRREAHRRLMLLATVGGLMWPTITRLPYVAGRFLPMFGLLALFVLAGAAYDLLTRRRVHPVYLWGGLLILVSLPVRRAVGLSETWHSVAAWLIG